MHKRRLVQYAILGGGTICGLIAFGSQFSNLINNFSSGDRAVASVILIIAAAIGLLVSSYGTVNPRLRELALAAMFLGMSVFSLIFALTGSGLAAILAVWCSCFAVFRTLQPTEFWTRPAAIATILAMLLWLSSDANGSSYLKEFAASWSVWLSSCFLDSVTIAHVRDTTSINTLHGSLSMLNSAESVFGALPLLALISLIAVAGRKSLAQAFFMYLFALMTWICIVGIAGWLTIWGVSGDAPSAAIDISSVPLYWTLLGFLLGSAVGVMTSAITDMIPIERSDWDYPTATYFWNFFSRFPVSLTSDPEGRS